jgi:hypothetical protein
MRSFGGLCVFVAMAIGSAPRAQACAELIELQIKAGPQLVADAEQLVEKHRYQQALDTLRRAVGETDSLDRHMRLLRVVARMRLAKARKPNVFLANSLVRTLRELAAEEKLESPYLQARLAEALAFAGQDAAAKTILDDLRARDLMPDAEAWATLKSLEPQPAQALAAGE